MEYFNEDYKNYRNILREKTNYVGNAREVEQAVGDTRIQCNNLKNYVSSSSLTGQAADYLKNSIVTELNSRTEILGSNVDDSLVPAVESLKELDTSLEEMEEKQKDMDEAVLELEIVKANISNLRSSLSRTSRYSYNEKTGYRMENSEWINISNELNRMLSEESRITELITLLTKELEELQKKCELLISTIKRLGSLIKKFGTFFGFNIDSIFENRLSNIKAVRPDGMYLWEQDGIYFMVPTNKNSNTTIALENSDYYICFDSTKLRETLIKNLGEKEAAKEFRDTGKTIDEYIIDELNKAIETQNERSGTVFAFVTDQHNTKNRYFDYRKAISVIVDQMLEDTYAYNNATTVEDYAVLSAMTIAANPIVHFAYLGNRGLDSTIGTEEIIQAGGEYDCIGFVRWSYYQGINKVYPDRNVDYTNIQVSNILNDDNITSKIDADYLSNPDFDIYSLTPGTVITKDDPLHTGIIIGTGTDSKGQECYVVAEATQGSEGGRNGAIIKQYALDNFYFEWIKTDDKTTRAIAGVTPAPNIVEKILSESKAVE